MIPIISFLYNISPKEIEHAGEVVTRDDLLNKVWEEDAFPTPRTVDNYILSIRKKIESDRENPKHILTIPRAGYKFNKGEEDQSKP